MTEVLLFILEMSNGLRLSRNKHRLSEIILFVAVAVCRLTISLLKTKASFSLKIEAKRKLVVFVSEWKAAFVAVACGGGSRYDKAENIFGGHNLIR